MKGEPTWVSQSVASLCLALSGTHNVGVLNLDVIHWFVRVLWEVESAVPG